MTRFDIFFPNVERGDRIHARCARLEAMRERALELQVSFPVTATIFTLTMNPAVDVATTVERIAHTHKLRCAEERRDPGGGGINVARVLRRFGEHVLAILPAGGPIGNLLDAMMAAEGVPRRIVPIAGNTREDFTVSERATGAEYRFVLPGPTLSETETEIVIDLLLARAPRDGLLVASGSLPPGVPEDFYARVADLCTARGTRLVLDASGAPLRHALSRHVFVVKPSLRELCDLTGANPDDQPGCIRECRKLVAQGAADMVALTLGEKGAVLITRDGVLRAKPLPVQAVVSSVGAGDSFLGGLVWSLSRNHAPEEALKVAVAAGTAALLSEGTGLCRIDDVMRLKNQVVITREPALAVA